MKKLITVLLVATLIITVGIATAETVANSVSVPVTIDLTPLFQAAIALLAALITGRLLPWIKERTTKEQQERLAAVTKTLVYAAQQLYKTGAVKDRLDYVEDGLKARGFTADRAAIEAAVRELDMTNAFITVRDGIAIESEDYYDE